MGKIKGWTKIKDTAKNFKKKLIFSENVQYTYEIWVSDMQHIWLQSAYYSNGREEALIKITLNRHNSSSKYLLYDFKTKKEALAFAVRYMKSHPRG